MTRITFLAALSFQTIANTLEWVWPNIDAIMRIAPTASDEMIKKMYGSKQQAGLKKLVDATQLNSRNPPFVKLIVPSIALAGSSISS